MLKQHKFYRYEVSLLILVQLQKVYLMFLIKEHTVILNNSNNYTQHRGLYTYWQHFYLIETVMVLLKLYDYRKSYIYRSQLGSKILAS